MHTHTRMWTHTHARDSFAIGWNYGGNERERGNDPHKLTPTPSSWPARKLAILLRAKADLATYHKFPASHGRYPVRSLCPFRSWRPRSNLNSRTVDPGCLSADERRLSFSTVTIQREFAILNMCETTRLEEN